MIPSNPRRSLQFGSHLSPSSPVRGLYGKKARSGPVRRSGHEAHERDGPTKKDEPVEGGVSFDRFRYYDFDVGTLWAALKTPYSALTVALPPVAPLATPCRDAFE